jgi:FkbM family methyltransferase
MAVTPLLKYSLQGMFRFFGLDLQRSRLGLNLNCDLQSILNRDESSVIFDVGANVGQSATRFARLFPKASIFSFEPSRSVFPVLVGNTRALPNITHVNVALGAEKSAQKLLLNEQGSRMNSLRRRSARAEANGSSGEEDVDVISLDSYVEGVGVKAIDLLKTDTEGYDLEVLKGAHALLAANRIKAILCEVAFVELYIGQALFPEIYSFLQNKGFELTGLYQQSYRGGKYIVWCDALFVNPSFVADRT